MKPKLFLPIVLFAISFIVIDSAFAQSTVSEGVYTIESNVVNNINYTGQGVKVAVIDTGFNVTNPEISANIVNYTSFRSDGDITAGNNTKHGTAVSQIVVDVAPDVELYLYNFGLFTNFDDTVDHIISLGDIDIVTMSGSFFGAGPYDGTSDIAQKVNEVRANGTLWINSAGNYGNKHWNGTFTDTNSNNYADFGTDDDINITVTAGKTIKLELTWDDPWGASSNNYDLYLKNSTNGSVKF